LSFAGVVLDAIANASGARRIEASGPTVALRILPANEKRASAGLVGDALSPAGTRIGTVDLDVDASARSMRGVIQAQGGGIERGDCPQTIRVLDRHPST